MHTVRYNYIFFLPDSDFYQVIYRDLNKIKGVRAYFGYKPSLRILYPIFKLHWAKKVNNIINLPYKDLWYPILFNDKFDNVNPYCFIFMAADLEDDNIHRFANYLHFKYPTAKFVAYYTDLVNAPYRKKMSNPRNLDEMFDLVVSYDKEDSIKYNIGYCPTSFSEIRIPVPTKISTDVYFLGKAKDRMAKIVEVYNLLTNKGLVCDFYVSGVTDKEKYSYSGIHFIEKMSYVDNLKHVASSNCILDIQQGNAKGFTLRIWEAINFNKKLITDNNEFCMSEFYSKDFVIKIDEIANLDMKSIVSRDCCSNKYAEFIRPTRLIEYLDLNVQ